MASSAPSSGPVWTSMTSPPRPPPIQGSSTSSGSGAIATSRDVGASTGPRPPPPPGERGAAGPPGTGKTHLAIVLAIRACLAGQRVLFATATEWVARLQEAQRAGRLAEEIVRLGRIPLLVVDEVGYIPFDQHAANLIFQAVSARYERASRIVTSNKPFSAWGEIFGDEVVAAAMIDRLVHHAEILALKGDSYRLKGKDLATRPRPALADPA